MKVLEKDFTLGEYGTAQLSVDSMLVLEAEIKAKVDIIKELKELADKTNTPLDDKIVDGLEQFLKAANAVLDLQKQG